MKNLILGATDIIKLESIEKWILTAKQFKDGCDIVLLVYNFDDLIIQNNIELFKDVTLIYIKDTAFLEGVQNVFCDLNHTNKENSINLIHHLRFFHYWQFLKDVKGRYVNVIITDVRDVIFNNLDFLNLRLDKILVADECIRIVDENWNKNNIINNFGYYIYDEIKNNNVLCCGVIAGNIDDILELSLMLYHIASGRYVADQSGLNVLCYTNTYYNNKIEKTKDFFQVYTRVFLQNVSTNPEIDPHKILQYPIIHQYDRYPPLDGLVKNKIKELG